MKFIAEMLIFANFIIWVLLCLIDLYVRKNLTVTNIDYTNKLITLSYGKDMKNFSYILVFACQVLIVISIYFNGIPNNSEDWFYFLDFVLLIEGLSIFFIFEMKTKVIFNDEMVLSKTFLGKEIKLLWSDIDNVTFSYLRRSTKLGFGKKNLRISNYLSGYYIFLQVLMKKHPVFRATILKRMMGNS